MFLNELLVITVLLHLNLLHHILLLGFFLGGVSVLVRERRISHELFQLRLELLLILEASDRKRSLDVFSRSDLKISVESFLQLNLNLS